jgi:SAM-dependent methyltransferase
MYNQLARYYDLIHESLTADIPFLLQLAAETASPTGREAPLLELGCGSGRLLLPLARAGYKVTGLDNSAAMLALAQERLAAEPPAVQSRVRLVEGDMSNGAAVLPGEDGRYRLIVAGYNTWMHLAPAQTVLALHGSRSLLRPDGRLFLDLANPFALAETDNTTTLALETIVHDRQRDEVVVQLSAQRADTAEQIVDVTWLFDVSAAGGGPLRRHVVEMRYHYHFPHELELLLAQAGFRLDALYGDYDRSPFGETSERLLLIGSPAA